MKLLTGLEESRVELESVWNSVNLINIVTDKLDMDRFTSVSSKLRNKKILINEFVFVENNKIFFNYI